MIPHYYGRFSCTNRISHCSVNWWAACALMLICGLEFDSFVESFTSSSFQSVIEENCFINTLEMNYILSRCLSLVDLKCNSST